MMRNLYRLLLALHPAEFRREFAGEMLWIFDETASTMGALPLFGDVLASLVRQWLVRSGAWPYAVGAILNGTLFTLAFLWPDVPGGGPTRPGRAWAEPTPTPVHYRLYVYMVSPAWNESKEAEKREP